MLNIAPQLDDIDRQELDSFLEPEDRIALAILDELAQEATREELEVSLMETNSLLLSLLARNKALGIDYEELVSQFLPGNQGESTQDQLIADVVNSMEDIVNTQVAQQNTITSIVNLLSELINADKKN